MNYRHTTQMDLPQNMKLHKPFTCFLGNLIHWVLSGLNLSKLVVSSPDAHAKIMSGDETSKLAAPNYWGTGCQDSEIISISQSTNKQVISITRTQLQSQPALATNHRYTEKIKWVREHHPATPLGILKMQGWGKLMFICQANIEHSSLVVHEVILVEITCRTWSWQEFSDYYFIDIN